MGASVVQAKGTAPGLFIEPRAVPGARVYRVFGSNCQETSRRIRNRGLQPASAEIYGVLLLIDQHEVRLWLNFPLCADESDDEGNLHRSHQTQKDFQIGLRRAFDDASKR